MTRAGLTLCLFFNLTLWGGVLWLSWGDAQDQNREAFYRVSWAPTAEGPWEHLATVPSDPMDGTMFTVLPVPGTNGARFFRVVRFHGRARADDTLFGLTLHRSDPRSNAPYAPVWP